MVDQPKQQSTNTRSDKISNFNQKQAVKNANPAQTSILSTVTKEQKQEADKQELIKNKAAQTKEVRQQEKQAQQEELKQEEQQAKQNSDALKQASQIASKVQENVDEKIDPLKKFFSQVPTPGGIASMLLLLGFFLLAVLPVNKQGDTRLKLLWLTLTGKTHLSYSGTSQETTPALKQAIDVVGGHGGPDEQNGYVPDVTGFEQIDIMSFLFDS